MSRIFENTGFICVHCGKIVSALTNGGYRNHCPFCLFSLHVDKSIGDRESECFGQMEPKDIIYNSKKGYQIVHVCRKCGTRKTNKVAYNTDMPDDFDVVLSIMNRSV